MIRKRIDIGRRFAVFPFFDGGEVDPGDRIPILIGHGKAFGSGEHETTASCLEELEEIARLGGAVASAAHSGLMAPAVGDVSNSEASASGSATGLPTDSATAAEKGLRHADVLDLGAGTGILAIAAAKLGARSVVAVEPEPEAVDATIRNVRLNGVGAVVQILAGDVAVVKGRRFDLVLANIYGDVLVPIAPDIARLLAPAGRVVLSGIHFDFAYDVKTAYAKEGLEFLRSRALENSCTFVFRKA